MQRHPRPADAWPLLPRVTAPTLLVRGEHSPILPAAMAQEMATCITSSRVVEIPRAHHHLMLDEPGAFAAAPGGFLAANS